MRLSKRLSYFAILGSLMVFGISFLNKARLYSTLKINYPYHLHNIEVKMDTFTGAQDLAHKQIEIYEIPSRKNMFNFSNSSGIVCITFMGRLGNLMLEYAFLYAMAKSKGLYPIIPEDSNLPKIFSIHNTTLSRIGLPKDACLKLPFHKERWGLSFDEHLFKIPRSKRENYRFHGYFQSWKYWIKYEKEIRSVFQFNDEIKRKAVSQFQEILKERDFTLDKDSVVVSVHVRREDYLSKEVVNYGKLTPGATFYFNAMSFFKDKFSKVLFIVGSTDTEWCRRTFDGEPNTHISTGNSAAEDMALLSLANHTIMSVGTYGWWVGWMSGGISIYYKHIFVPGSPFSKNFRNNSIDDFIYPGWIPMD